MNSEDSPSPTGLESYLVRLAWHSTLGLAVVVVMGMASPELLGPVVVVFSSLLFALGLGMLALGLLAGLRRSRDEEVTVTGLFLLYGSAPLKVRKVFGWALGLQLVVACAGAAVRPYRHIKAIRGRTPRFCRGQGRGLEDEMIDRLKVSRVVNADLPSCYALVEDVQNYGSWVNDIREVSVEERDSQDRVTQATFRVAAMGRSATYSLLYDYSESPSTIHWQLAAGDIIKQLDGSYKFETLVDSPDQTEVTYELAIELAIPLPGFVKRRAEGRIFHAALDDFQRRVEL